MRTTGDGVLNTSCGNSSVRMRQHKQILSLNIVKSIDFTSSTTFMPRYHGLLSDQTKNLCLFYYPENEMVECRNIALLVVHWHNIDALKSLSCMLVEGKKKHLSDISCNICNNVMIIHTWASKNPSVFPRKLLMECLNNRCKESWGHIYLLRYRLCIASLHVCIMYLLWWEMKGPPR